MNFTYLVCTSGQFEFLGEEFGIELERRGRQVRDSEISLVLRALRHGDAWGSRFGICEVYSILITRLYNADNSRSATHCSSYTELGELIISVVRVYEKLINFK